MKVFTIYKYPHCADVEADVILSADDESPCKSYRTVAQAETAIKKAKVGAGNSYQIFDVMTQKYIK
jgi:hypothetical protein